MTAPVWIWNKEINVEGGKKERKKRKKKRIKSADYLVF